MKTRYTRNRLQQASTLAERILLFFLRLANSLLRGFTLVLQFFQLVTEEFLSAKQKVKAESTTTYH